jgi:hypothetical protein
LSYQLVTECSFCIVSVKALIEILTHRNSWLYKYWCLDSGYHI